MDWDGVFHAKCHHCVLTIQHSPVCLVKSTLPRGPLLDGINADEQFKHIAFIMTIGGNNENEDDGDTCICLAPVSERQQLNPDKITIAENTWCGQPRCQFAMLYEENDAVDESGRFSEEILQSQLDERRNHFKKELDTQKRLRPELKREEDLEIVSSIIKNVRDYEEGLKNVQQRSQGPVHVLDMRALADGKLDQVLPFLLTAYTRSSSKEEEPNDCAICAEALLASEDIIRLPCHEKHQFHRLCIIDHIKVHKKCPMCRAEWNIYCFGGYKPYVGGVSLTAMLDPPLETWLHFIQPFPVQIWGFIADGAREGDIRRQLRFESAAALADIWGEHNDKAALLQERADWMREQKVRMKEWEDRLEKGTSELDRLMQEERLNLVTLKTFWSDLEQVDPDSTDASQFTCAIAVEINRAASRARWLRENRSHSEQVCKRLKTELLQKKVLEYVGYFYRDKEPHVVELMQSARRSVSMLESNEWQKELEALQKKSRDWISAKWHVYGLPMHAIRDQAEQLVKEQEETERQKAADEAQTKQRGILKAREEAEAERK